MKHARKLGLGRWGNAALGLWGTAVAAAVAAPWVPAIDRLDNLHRTVLAAAITVTLVWVIRGGEGGTVHYKLGYFTGRADERREQQDARRVRTLRVDDIDVTVVGGDDRPLSGDTVRLIQEYRAARR